jgi:hypothetical protein
MVFWIAILTGGVFVWLAVRVGFYEMVILSFNVAVSVYVGIFLAPVIAALAPAAGTLAPYSTALGMVVLAGGCFAILQGLAYVFLTGQFSIPFPRAFDILLAGLLGFVAGFLALSFAALAVTTTPLGQHKIVSSLGLGREAQQTNIACMGWCCDRIHWLVRVKAGKDATRAAVDRLFAERDSPESGSGESRPDANDPPIMRRRGVQPRGRIPADAGNDSAIPASKR